MYYTMKFTDMSDFENALNQYAVREYLYKGLSMLLEEKQSDGDVDAVNRLNVKLEEIKRYSRYISTGLFKLNDKERFMISETIFNKRKRKVVADEIGYCECYFSTLKQRALRKLYKYSIEASKEEYLGGKRKLEGY